jgi:hypothetical protein
MTRSGPESANDSTHISFLSSLYCPGCDTERDPLREILTVHWCDAHRPRSDGLDDRRTTLGRSELCAFPDAEADTNRLWCELLHRTLNRSKPARRSRPPSRTPGRQPGRALITEGVAPRRPETETGECDRGEEGRESTS